MGGGGQILKWGNYLLLSINYYITIVVQYFHLKLESRNHPLLVISCIIRVTLGWASKHLVLTGVDFARCFGIQRASYTKKGPPLLWAENIRKPDHVCLGLEKRPGQTGSEKLYLQLKEIGSPPICDSQLVVHRDWHIPSTGDICDILFNRFFTNLSWSIKEIKFASWWTWSWPTSLTWTQPWKPGWEDHAWYGWWQPYPGQ